MCVRAGRRVCVCVKQIHTYSSRELPSVAAGAGSGARLRCQTRELPSIAAGALSRACSRRVFAGVAAGAGSGARLRCQTRELARVTVGARSRSRSRRRELSCEEPPYPYNA